MRSCLMFTLVIFGGFFTFVAHAEQSHSPNLARGEQVYKRYCAGCHGASGQGDGYRILGADPADFTAPATKEKSDAVLLETIHEGELKMPAWKPRLSQEEVLDVLAYIRELARHKP